MEFDLPGVHFRTRRVRTLPSKPPTIEAKEFVLETRGRAVLAFLAGGLEQARDLCSQHWFIDELASYRSCGQPIWDGAAEVQIALATERCRKEYNGYVFAFLVPVDANLQ